MDSTTDFSVVFEGSYNDFNEQYSSLITLPLDRNRYSFIIHSIPEDTSKRDIKKLASRVSQHSDLFSLIDLKENFYERFSPNWPSFIDVMPS